MAYYVYKMIHLPTGRLYIGQRKIPAGKTPQNDGYRGSGKIWKKIYKAHPDECVKIILGMYNTKDEVNQAEISLIKHYKTVWGKFCVNLTEGGEGMCRKHTEESKRKMSETKRDWTPEQKAKVRANQSKAHKGQIAWNKGVRSSAEAIEKNRQAHIGKKASDETKRKMSEARMGRKMSDESRRKLSEATKGRVISEEQRKKLAAAHKGKPWSEARRAAWLNSKRKEVA